MPFGGAVTLGAITALPKLYASYKQSRAADKLKLQDSTPAAFREKMALDKQAAAAGVMPGQVGAQTRLAGVQAGALNAARLGAASSGDLLAAAGQADARRQAGEQQLSQQAAQYGIRAQQQVGADLSQQAAYQKNDLDTYNKTKAALIQGSAENLNNAVEGAASYAAYGMNAGTGGLGGIGVAKRQAADAEMGSEELSPRVVYPTSPGIPTGLSRPRYRTSRYGIPAY